MNARRRISVGLLALAWGVAMFAATDGKAPQQTALEALERALGKFETLVTRDDDAKHRVTEQVALEDFKQRREALRATFDQGKYDELRVDLNLEYQRLAAWMAAPKNPPAPKTPVKP